MRKGTYAIYKGIEYEAGSKDSNSVSLLSYNKDDVAKGFSLYKGVVYVKRVQRSELDEVYIIHPFAIYQGYRFGVEREEGDKMLLFTSDFSVYQKLKLTMIDRGIYEIWVNKSDITSYYEEKNHL